RVAGLGVPSMGGSGVAASSRQRGSWAMHDRPIADLRDSQAPRGRFIRPVRPRVTQGEMGGVRNSRPMRSAAASKDGARACAAGLPDRVVTGAARRLTGRKVAVLVCRHGRLYWLIQGVAGRVRSNIGSYVVATVFWSAWRVS